MGITVLGDIIAILKHAKQVQSRLTTDRALSQSKKPDRVKVDSSEKDPPLTSQHTVPLIESGNVALKESRMVRTAKVDDTSSDAEISKKSGYSFNFTHMLNSIQPVFPHKIISIS